MRRTIFAVAILVLSGMIGPSQSEQLASPGSHPSSVVSTVLGAEGVLGKEVRSVGDERLGRVVDVVVDRAGRVRAAVIDYGGFMGVGSRRIAVDWNALSFTSDYDRQDVVTLELTRDQLKTAPEYKDKRAVTVLGAAGTLQSNPFH